MKTYYIHNLNHQYIGKSFKSQDKDSIYDVAWNLFGLNCCDDFLIFDSINKTEELPISKKRLIYESELNDFEKDITDFY